MLRYAHLPQIIVSVAAMCFAVLFLPTSIIAQDSSVTSNDEWQPVIETIGGFEMALVPEGCFMMGSSDNNRDERPVHEQCIESEFYIDVFEVTNEAYGSSGTFDQPQQPRETISWTDAQAFCEQRGGRLPTEAEWEFAARGPDSLVYPWGNTFESDNYVWQANSQVRTAVVGSIEAGQSWVGAFDLSGNVWEWTSTLYEDYPYNANDRREDLEANGERTIRGGAYNFSQPARGSIRNGNFEAFDERNNIGFRCVLGANGIVATPPDVSTQLPTETTDNAQVNTATATNNVAPTPVASATPMLTPTPSLPTLTIVNNSDERICYVFFSTGRLRISEGFDQLGAREVIFSGEERTWDVPAGTYDVQLSDCNLMLLDRFDDVVISGDATLEFE